MIYDIIIIGTGPAGIASAIQLKRFGINPLVIEKHRFGGLLRNANLVENYLGFPRGLSGVKFTNLMKKQFDKYAIDIVYENVTNINYNKNCEFIVQTNRYKHKSSYVIIATGTKPKKPDLIINNNIKNKVFYDVYDLLNAKNKHIAIIGAGDAAFDYAINLSKKNNIIKILNRGNKIKAIKLLRDRCDKIKNIEYLENISVKKIEPDKNPKKIKLTTNSSQKIVVDYFLVAIGREPNLDILEERLKNNDRLFIIGDAKNGVLRQTAIAVGDGLKVAQKIFKLITE
ncbi:NAD(P)/FAD-dependent oxidoreductase [Pseudomonadota bacterium]